MTRPGWDRYFMNIAHEVGKRMTCDRVSRGIGAVLVANQCHIIGTGYGGSPPGAPHCDEVGHLMVNGHCVRTIHAEVNALAHCARHGVATAATTLYVTTQPCFNCAKLLVAGGVQQVIFEDLYHHLDETARVLELEKAVDIRFYRLTLRDERWPLHDSRSEGVQYLFRAVDGTV